MVYTGMMRDTDDDEGQAGSAMNCIAINCKQLIAIQLLELQFELQIAKFQQFKLQIAKFQQLIAINCVFKVIFFLVFHVYSTS